MTSKKLWRGLLVGLAAIALMGAAGVAFAGVSPGGRVTLPSPVSEPPTGESSVAESEGATGHGRCQVLRR